MKKLLSVFFAAVLAFSLVACGGGSNSKDKVVIGDTTKLEGNFIVGWGNNAADVNIRELINAYSTIARTPKGELVVNDTVVKELTGVTNADGTKTFTFKLNDALAFNDDTPITAKDFLFQIMFNASAVFADLEGQSALGAEYLGYKSYNTGETSVFEGLHLIDDHSFSITVSSKYVPFFFEKSLLVVTPLPMHVLAPSASIEETAGGAEMKGLDKAEIEKTVLDPQTGYRYHPKVTAGPYNLKEYDTGKAIATLELNDKYLGNYEGQKPSIKTIIYRDISQKTVISELETGSVDIFNATGATEIEGGRALVEADKLQEKSFLRNGYGMVVLHTNQGPTQFVKVRQAISFSLDKVDFAKTFTKGYGQVVYSDYAIAQWQTNDMKAELDEKLNKYPVDLEKAKSLLVEDGWIYDANGGAYESGIRYKKLDDGTLMPGIIKWFSTTDNEVSTLLSSMLPKNLEAIGLSVEKSETDFPTLSKELKKADSEYTMFNLAKGFTEVYNPEYAMSSDTKYFGTYNWNMLADPELSELAARLCKRDASDVDGYLQDWLAIQVRFNELVPNIPLYSNEYFVFFNNRLENFEPDSYWKITDAISYANLK